MFEFWPGNIFLMNEGDNDQASRQLIMITFIPYHEKLQLIKGYIFTMKNLLQNP